MKTAFLRNHFFLVGLVLIVLTTTGCESKIDFEKTKKVKELIASPIEGVTNYYIRFNPRGSSTIIITLTNGEEYTASDLNQAQAASLHAILSEKNIQFDTENEAFVLNAFSYD